MRDCLTIDDVGDLDDLDNGLASILRVEGNLGEMRLARIDHAGRLRALDHDGGVFDVDHWQVREVVA